MNDMALMVSDVDEEQVEARMFDLLKAHASEDAIKEVSSCMDHGEEWIGTVIAARYLIDYQVAVPPDLLADFGLLAKEIGDPDDLEVYEDLKSLQ